MVATPDVFTDNADWTKQSWDIPADNADELLAFLSQHGITVAHFKTMPVYEMNAARFDWLANLTDPREAADGA